MRRTLIAANWKMYGSYDLVAAFTAQIRLKEEVEVAVFPPALFLQAMVAAAPEGLASGVQDIGTAPQGAHTGEIAAEMVHQVGGRWAIVGHSERRIMHDERDDLVATKAAAAVRGGLRPVICVGETLDERRAGHELAVVERQLAAVLDRVAPESLANCVIGYEPVWAIGTGETASPEQAQQMHAFIRQQIAAESAQLAQQLRIVYGGSVNPDNAAELFSQPDIDGGLVGGASLEIEQFNAIIAAA